MGVHDLPSEIPSHSWKLITDRIVSEDDSFPFGKARPPLKGPKGWVVESLWVPQRARPASGFPCPVPGAGEAVHGGMVPVGLVPVRQDLAIGVFLLEYVAWPM